MRKILLIWIAAFILLAMPLIATDTLIFNETFTTDTGRFYTNGTIANGILNWSGTGYALLTEQLPDRNISNYTYEFKMKVYNSKSNGWIFFLKNKNTTGSAGYAQQVFGHDETHVAMWHYNGGTWPTEDLATQGAYHYYKFTVISNNSVNVTVDGSYIGNFDDVPAGYGHRHFLFQGEPTTGIVEIDYFSLYNGSIAISSAPPPGPSQDFTITAKNRFNSKTITNFTVIVSNASDTYMNITTTGQVNFENFSLSALYNITVNSTEGGGYFNSTFLNYNASTALASTLEKSVIVINVTDAIFGTPLGGGYTLNTNYSSYTPTSSSIILPTQPGTHNFNISSSQYPLQSFNYEITSNMENTTYIANLSPTFNFYLRREEDNSIFKINETNTTRLTIYCPNKNIVIYFKNESATSRNSTQENITMDCPYTYMKMDVYYESSSYFRTLVPPTNQNNITWWLLDLNRDTGVQVNIDLVDLTGEFSNGLIRIKRAIGASTETMIEQYFDIESSTINYLLKDAFYTILIESTSGVERQLGTLIADAAGTKTITLPSIPYYPDKVYYDNISWAYTFNTTSGVLRLQYQDLTAATEYIQWDIYNGTNASNMGLIQTFSSTTPGSSVMFTYNNPLANQTYLTKLHIEHPLLDFNVSESRTFGDYSSGYLTPFLGFSAAEEHNIKFYASAIFLVVWGLLFSARHIGIGLTSTFFWIVVLRWIGWFTIDLTWLALIGLISVLSWIVEAMKK